MWFCRLGVLACYLDPVELGSFLRDSAVSSALWQQLAQCMSKGLISTSGRVSGTGSLLLFRTCASNHQHPECLFPFNCVPWTAVLLVDTSRGEPERQQHDSPRAVHPQRTLPSVRSFLPAVTALTAAHPNPLTVGVTEISSSTGWQGIFFFL